MESKQSAVDRRPHVLDEQCSPSSEDYETWNLEISKVPGRRLFPNLKTHETCREISLNAPFGSENRDHTACGHFVWNWWLIIHDRDHVLG